MSAPRLWLVRHAQPLVAPGTCYGVLDVPADPAATLQAAQQLAQALPQGCISTHSPLQRCELLALSLQALRPDLAFKPDTNLAEMDFGAWEGRAWSAIARSDIDAWTADFTGQRCGGGETLAAMLQRVAAALHQARQAAARQQCDVLWISHAGVARCVQWLMGVPSGDDTAQPAAPRAHQWPLTAPAFGAWTTFPL